MPHLGAVVSTVRSRLRQTARDKGATMVEYALLITFIAMVVFAALFALGPLVRNLYTGVVPSL